MKTGAEWIRLNYGVHRRKYRGMPVNNSNHINAEDNFDMAMSLEEADAILAQHGFVDSEAELELV